jgi:hypothetical protein
MSPGSTCDVPMMNQCWFIITTNAYYRANTVERLRRLSVLHVAGMGGGWPCYGPSMQVGLPGSSSGLGVKHREKVQDRFNGFEHAALLPGFN